MISEVTKAKRPVNSRHSLLDKVSIMRLISVVRRETTSPGPVDSRY
jgi:hypothetical protein